MNQPDQPSRILAELDAVHDRMREGYRTRNLELYLSAFAPDLEYRDPRGGTLSHTALALSVGEQLDRLVSIDGRFERDTISVNGDAAEESGTQTAEVSQRLLLVFAVRWKVVRRVRNTWSLGPDGWRLRRVEVASERTTRQGLGLARQKHLPAG